MAWRLARSLETLLGQIDARWPNRDKSEDGSIGDAAHRATQSDHNPNAADVVTAIDIDRDIAVGLNARALAEALVASRDPRIKYIISNAQIISSKVQPWVWRPYDGQNAHREHIHVSVMGDPALYDDTSPWQIRALPGTIPTPVATPGARRFTNIKATVFNDGIRPGTETAYRFPMPPDFMGYSLPGRITGELPLRITNRATGLSAIGNKADIGPWYDGTAARGPEDRWWENGTRPRAETDPRTNGAGIDLYPALARAIGIQIVERDGRIVAGETQVDVEIISETPPMAESNTDRLLSALIESNRALGEQIAALARVINFGQEPTEPKPPIVLPEPPKPPVVITPPVAAPPIEPLDLKTLILSAVGAIVAPATGISETVDKGTLGSLIPFAGMAASALGIPSWILPMAGRFLGRMFSPTGGSK